VPYLTLDEIPEGRLCRPLFIPDDPLWLALFGGALTELEQTYNYQKFGTLTPQEMADACAEVIAQWYNDLCGTCELPEGGALLRVGEGGVLQQQQNGEWVEPNGDYAIPPLTARTEPTPEERRCLAAANAANVLKQTYEEVTDAYGTGLGVLEAIVAVGVFVATWWFAGAALIVKAVATAALGLWQLAFDTAEFVTADFWTPEFDDNIRCALYRSSTDLDGVVTFDWDSVNNELTNQINWFDPTLGSFSLAGQVRWLIGQIGIQGLNAAGTTTGITEADCSECGAAWCYVWDFEAGQGDWAFYPDAYWAGGSRGEFDDGWKATNGGGEAPAYGGELMMRIPFAFPSTLKFIRIEYEKIAGDFSLAPTNDYVILDGAWYTGTILVGGDANFTGEGLLQWSGSVEVMSYVNMWLHDSLTGYNGGYGSLRVRRIVMRGSGENPVGEDNC